MTFIPEWVNLLPLNLKPDEKSIRKLEDLRADFDIPHDALSMRILCSPATTRKIQKESYAILKRNDPQKTDQQIFQMVLISRLQAVPYDGINDKEIDDIIKNMNSIDELCDYIIALDDEESAFPDPFDIGRKIDEILDEESRKTSFAESAQNNQSSVGTHKNSLSKAEQLLQNKYLQMPVEDISLLEKSYVEDDFTQEAQRIIRDVLEKRKNEIENYRKETISIAKEEVKKKIVKIFPERWECSKCGSINGSTRITCWNCGRTKAEISSKTSVHTQGFQYTSCFYPADKTKSDSGSCLFLLKIEGERIGVERTKEGRICVSKGDEKIKEIPKNKSSKVTKIEVTEHNLSIQYKETPTLLGMLFWNSGFRIHVDGKPVEGTSADPQERIKVAACAFYLFAAIALFNVFVTPNPDARVEAIILLLIFVVFGFLTRKVPIFTTMLGSLFGIYEVSSYLAQAFQSGYVTQHTGWFIFWFLLRGGATLALIQGLVAGIMLRLLKKKFVKK